MYRLLLNRHRTLNRSRRACPLGGLLVLAICCLMLVRAPALASSTDGASAFIEQLGQQAIHLVTDNEKSQDEKTREFRDLLRRGFALDSIAQFVLGRYWRQADEKQQMRYTSLFEDYLVASYSSRFHEYSGESFEVVAEKASTDNDILVTTTVRRPQGAEVLVNWQVRETGDGLKIFDVVIEGVSMSLTQRSDFAAAIRSKGGNLDSFLDVLEQKTRQLSSR